MAAGRDEYLTPVGIDTYLDPRNGGGKCNAITREDLVSVVELGGRETNLLPQLPIHVAIIRGTVADEEGNLEPRARAHHHELALPGAAREALRR